MSWSASRIAIVTSILAGFGLGIGIIIGHFGITSPTTAPPTVAPPPTEDESIIQKLMDEISANNIRENLRSLTERPHIAGRDQDENVLVKLIEESWKASSFDSVRVYSYDVLLSYPKQGDSNYIAVVDQNGDESDVSQRKELVIDSEQNDTTVVDPFNAYAKAGEPEGDLVYVNFGQIEDFMLLNRTLNISTSGKICIARYGRIFRGDKDGQTSHAEEYGCKGLILYSDPIDYTVPWEDVYPDGWFLPGTGVQRGTLWLDNGDPETPNYPSIPTAYRVPEDELKLPQIPVTPIGYVDAIKYLRKMGGPEVNDTWKGGLNITYRYGPGFTGDYSTSQIKMSVKTETEIATAKNVIGFIRGAVEPDRYVLLGNHRDAWVFGAIDPSSGTAVQLELARALGEMINQGWRPRRTIVFCSWGAEEYGLIGSSEWVEELQKELQFRAIAYLNVDISVQGNHSFRGSGVSSFRDIVFDVTKLIDNPDQAEVTAGRTKVYDTWLDRWEDADTNLPVFGSLGSGSDYTAFLQFIGVAAVDLRFTYDENIGVASYPVYHSVYETFNYVSTHIDPEFVIHRAMAQIWGEMARRLADSVILPIDCRLYAKFLEKNRNSLYEGYGEEMTREGIDFNQMDSAIANFTRAAEAIHQRINDIDESNLMEVRAVNDQLMQLERAFIDQNPLLGRVAYRHVITAPSQHNSYGNTAFPGITDALFDIDQSPDPIGSWNEVKRQYSIVVFHIVSAAATLQPFV